MNLDALIAANQPHFYSPYIKRGPTPANCITGNPYCECRANQRCQLLADPEPGDDESGQ